MTPFGIIGMLLDQYKVRPDEKLLDSCKRRLDQCKQLSKEKDAERSRCFHLLCDVLSVLFLHRNDAWARELYEKIEQELMDIVRLQDLALEKAKEPPAAQADTSHIFMDKIRLLALVLQKPKGSPPAQADTPHIRERPPGAS